MFHDMEMFFQVLQFWCRAKLLKDKTPYVNQIKIRWTKIETNVLVEFY